jgi:signal transduction histidine kinase
MTMKEVKNNLKIALQDLRLVIDSLDGDAQDITTILGTLRMRLGDLLKKGNIELIWKVQDLPMLEEFGPEKSLNTMRIIQEAITNVIKHSGATRLTISTYSLEKNGGILAIVEITDNGCGMIKGTPMGRGLYNMKQRAQRMDALIEIKLKNKTGVSVLLVFLCG